MSVFWNLEIRKQIFFSNSFYRLNLLRSVYAIEKNISVFWQILINFKISNTFENIKKSRKLKHSETIPKDLWEETEKMWNKRKRDEQNMIILVLKWMQTNKMKSSLFFSIWLS